MGWRHISHISVQCELCLLATKFHRVSSGPFGYQRLYFVFWYLDGGQFGLVVFGLARGLAIVTGLVLLANLTPSIKQDSWWQESAILPGVQELAKSVHEKMPDDLATHFSFSS